MEELKKDGHTSTTLSDHKGGPYIEKADRICSQFIGVVVLYNVRVEESVTINSLNKSLVFIDETMDLVVYDNSLESDRLSGTIFIYGGFRIHYFHDGSNPGISKAYNFAAQYGKELKKEWLLVLDQDTTFPLDSIEKYSFAIHENPEIKLIAPVLTLNNGKNVSPCRYFLKRGFALKRVLTGVNDLKKISLLNSGMLINLGAFSLVGGYNEKVRLDFCDFVFIEEFKKMYSFCFILDVKCVHDFADDNSDIEKLNGRYGNYCRDAKSCPKESVIDWVQYFVVVFVRASSLVVRTGRLAFYKTMYRNFIK